MISRQFFYIVMERSTEKKGAETVEFSLIFNNYRSRFVEKETSGSNNESTDEIGNSHSMLKTHCVFRRDISLTS